MNRFPSVFLSGIVLCISLFSGEFRFYDIDSSQYPSFERHSARVFYPADISEMEHTGATTLMGGMFNTKEDMYWLAEAAARSGIIVIALSATDNTSVQGYVQAHISGVRILQKESDNVDAPVFDKIFRYGTMGFSMGGGGAINAASELGTAVHTSIGLAPYGPFPAASHEAATLILTGTDDTVAPERIGLRAYNALSENRSKVYAAMENAGHLYWYKRKTLQSESDFIIAWLQYYLRDRAEYYSVFSEGPAEGMVNYRFNDPSMAVIHTGSDGVPKGIQDIDIRDNALHIRAAKFREYGIRILTLQGRELVSSRRVSGATGRVSLDLSTYSLQSGVCIVSLVSHHGSTEKIILLP